MDKLSSFLAIFEKLSHDNKKKKVLNVLEYIKDNIDFAPSLIDFMRQQEDCSDDFLITVYKMIIQSALVESEKTNQLSLKKKVEYLTILHEQEAQAQAEDNRDSEKLLSSL